VLIDVDAYLTDQSRRGRFSGAVRITRGSQILLDQGYGTADRQRRRPNTPQTAF